MRFLLFAVLITMPLAAFAGDADIRVDHAWSRAAMVGHTGVVYLTLTDTGTQDTLISITTPAAVQADLHETINDHGVMKMRPVASLTVEPGKPLVLAPGGYHIMLMDLKHALKQGESFPITLNFAKAGAVAATVTVEKAGASAPMAGNMPNMSGMPQTGGSKL
jgi:copper(I)-binding protein